MNEYIPVGVCSRKISFDVENGVLKNVRFTAGCPGNLAGIAKLVEGMPAAEVVKRLKGITCGGKPTSCPDQLAIAVEKALAKKKATQSAAPMAKAAM